MGWVGWMMAPLFACMLALLVLSASAKEAVPEAADPVLEARMLAIAGELRCLVCQNETIAAFVKFPEGRTRAWNVAPVFFRKKPMLLINSSSLALRVRCPKEQRSHT